MGGMDLIIVLIMVMVMVLIMVMDMIMLTLMAIEKDRISSPWLKNDWVTFKIVKIFEF